MIFAIVAMILAAVVFLLKLLGLNVGSLDMIALGLLLMAVAFSFAWVWPYRDRRLR